MQCRGQTQYIVYPEDGFKAYALLFQETHYFNGLVIYN
jgi:hypothetical protein